MQGIATEMLSPCDLMGALPTGKNFSLYKNGAQGCRRNLTRRNYVGLSNILYRRAVKEGSEFFFRGEPAKWAHR